MASNGGISFEEFNRAVDIAQERHPEWRYGQTLFNVLYEHEPILADLIRSGPHDPFYVDGVADAFLAIVERELE